jgi:hypothetical protein
MVDHPALCVQATRAWTRVRALVVNASPGAVAVRVQHTLWPAPRVRVTRVLG